MSNFWQATSRPGSGTAASASIAYGGGPVASQVRLRALQAAGTGELVVRDGASGSGTVIVSVDIVGSVAISDLDVRASAGNALTVEFVAGSGQQNVSAQGDFVVAGTPYGAQG